MNAYQPPETDTVTLGRIATNIARNTGWPVFPCDAAKQPATAHGFLDASTDPYSIRRMFQNRNAALIAIATGAASGVDGLDIDAKHDAALAWLAAAEPRLPPTRVYRTRSGGVHLLFRHTEGVRNTQSKLARGVDTRGDGGYLILWFAAGFECLDQTPPAPWPEWLLTALFRKDVTIPVRALGRRYSGKGGRPEAMVSRALHRVATAAEGHRHETLRNAALTIGGVLHSVGLSRDQAAGLLLDATMRAGWDNPKKTADTIHWGLETGAASPLMQGAA